MLTKNILHYLACFYFHRFLSKVCLMWRLADRTIGLTNYTLRFGKKYVRYALTTGEKLSPTSRDTMLTAKLKFNF